MWVILCDPEHLYKNYNQIQHNVRTSNEKANLILLQLYVRVYYIEIWSVSLFQKA